MYCYPIHLKISDLFINLLNEAAKDDSVVSIKMTLYRLADKSQIVDALVEAAETEKKLLYL